WSRSFYELEEARANRTELIGGRPGVLPRWERRGAEPGALRWFRAHRAAAHGADGLPVAPSPGLYGGFSLSAYRDRLHLESWSRVVGRAGHAGGRGAMVAARPSLLWRVDPGDLDVPAAHHGPLTAGEPFRRQRIRQPVGLDLGAGGNGGRRAVLRAEGTRTGPSHHARATVELRDEPHVRGVMGQEALEAERLVRGLGLGRGLEGELALPHLEGVLEDGARRQGQDAGRRTCHEEGSAARRLAPPASTRGGGRFDMTHGGLLSAAGE